VGALRENAPAAPEPETAGTRGSGSGDRDTDGTTLRCGNILATAGEDWTGVLGVIPGDGVTGGGGG
jgi:hypothetical protein